MNKLIWSALVAVSLGTAACGDGGKAGAEAALQALESAYAPVKADVAMYLPDEATKMDAVLAAVQESVADGEYVQAMTDAQGMTAKVGELATAVASKKAELTKAWEGLGAGLPGVIENINATVAKLTTAKLPKGVTKEAIESARTSAAALSITWEQATAAFKSADLTDALAKAETVKVKAGEILASLGQPVPDSLK